MIWSAQYFCHGCEGRLSFAQMMDSRGVCPLCGYMEDDEPTIVPCKRRLARKIYTGKWWQFWQFRWEIKERK